MLLSGFRDSRLEPVTYALDFCVTGDITNIQFFRLKESNLCIDRCLFENIGFGHEENRLKKTLKSILMMDHGYCTNKVMHHVVEIGMKFLGTYSGKITKY